MRRRCYDPKNKRYPDYGERGIIVCPRWLGENGFINFISDMGRRPTKRHTVDRHPNNDGNYEPGNCRWGTKRQQARNRRSNVWYEADGKRKLRQDWIKYFKIHDATFHRLMKKHNDFITVYNILKQKRYGE